MAETETFVTDAMKNSKKEWINVVILALFLDLTPW
jgi:hypothetical protein